jgi:four helix bundle protein
MQDFRKLEVWQEARRMTTDIYRRTARFPADERFGLISQLRRCALSIGSDIAEGCGRATAPDITRFHQSSFASSFELLHQLITSLDLGYLNANEFKAWDDRLEVFRRRLSRLMTAIRDADQQSPTRLSRRKGRTDRNAKRSGPRTDGERSEPAEN